MRPAKAKFKKFKLDPPYVHMRSEGLTKRQNGGTRRLILDEPPPHLREQDRVRIDDDPQAGDR